jgi:hypothetical protein
MTSTMAKFPERVDRPINSVSADDRAKKLASNLGLNVDNRVPSPTTARIGTGMSGMYESSSSTSMSSGFDGPVDAMDSEGVETLATSAGTLVRS